MCHSFNTASLWKHEDILNNFFQNNLTADTDIYKSFKDDSAFKENNLFRSNNSTFYDFINVVNPLANKAQIHNISVSYFVLGNFFAKYKSHLKEVHLLILSPPILVTMDTKIFVALTWRFKKTRTWRRECHISFLWNCFHGNGWWFGSTCARGILL